MKGMWSVPILLVTLHLVVALPPGQLQRLARLVLPYVGEGKHHSLALARSLDGYSSLARRQNDREGDNVPDTGMTDFEDEDIESISKRQFDDYGHMRFGRNTGGANKLHKKFDDYGHMRYGK